MTLYTNRIFETAGNFVEPHIALIIVGVVQVVFVTAAMFLVDLLGRKVLLFWGGLIMGVSLIGLGTYFYIKEKNNGDESSIAWLPIVTVCTYLAAYSAGVGTIPWVLATEIFNPDFRGKPRVLS